MLKLITISLLISLTFQALPFPHPGKLEGSQAPEFYLDLRVPPKHRWDHIIPIFKDQLKKFFTEVVSKIDFPEEFLQKFAKWCENDFEYYEYVEEVQGIAAIAGLDWRKLMIANFSYEISTLPMCTSIVAKNINNKILHGRNIDFPFWGYFSKLTALIHFNKGGPTISSQYIQIGSVFTTTGYTPSVMTASIDTRHGQSLKPVWDNLLNKGYYPSAFYLRNVLLTAKNYEEAVQMLSYHNIAAPVYYIVGGTDQAAIIERSPTLLHNYTSIDTQSTEWFLVQTNYDRSGPDPKNDNRRGPAEKRMKEIGQQAITLDNMFENVLKKFPNLNIESMYTTRMSVDYRTLENTLWYGNITDYTPNADYEETKSEAITFLAFGEILKDAMLSLLQMEF